MDFVLGSEDIRRVTEEWKPHVLDMQIVKGLSNRQ